MSDEAAQDAEALVSRFTDACSAFDINASEAVDSLSAVLDNIASELAKNRDLRYHVGTGKPAFWSCLRKLWRDLVRTQLTFWDGDDDDQASTETLKHQNLRKFCQSLARLTRNLVAEVTENQTHAFENEPDIRRLLHYYTSWTAMEDQDDLVVARILSQTMSNLITANEPLMQSLWDTYMNLPEDQVVLIRLLQSSDGKSLVPAMMFIQNCIQGSRTRARLLVHATVGSRICVCLLDKMAKIYEAEEGSEEARAFDLGYAIFSRLMEVGLVPELYLKLSIKDEIVTPHQTVLLKLIDSYLQSTPLKPKDPTTTKILVKLSQMLGTCFFSMSSYSQRAIRRSLGSPSSEHFSPVVNLPSDMILPPTELDIMLPKVCEGLVLVSQCIVTVTLDAEKETSGIPSSSPHNIRALFNELRSENHSLAESLIELLRLLDRFLPRINFGKPVQTQTGQAPTPLSNASDTGFFYLKRDLVRLLGILCHEQKAVQDRVRQCGGIEVVMNLCVIDERNPYLREHAIFTLHNLLKGNPENQAIVQEIQPTGQWDENGVLKDNVGAVRK
ncbi:spinocerebellar ataxia type 10 protein domain-containing protein [Desarmillaria tabescens]|uniref:Ataxin-10 homolog n=1 Tax=Armillaria tabescens TaxID=1929756 RepID=A0AA39NKF5_ARMTA|nr:spinocerebellar ataxia type 10 protein domain-containing protein [Desarmillaria tabescens]KAK0467260.1 spinocerebellar ataxia type 10 protein domain-containing protein [Desarmillaria tabescens]